MKIYRPLRQSFHDIVERPHIELGGRFKEFDVTPPRIYTAEEIRSINDSGFTAPAETKPDYDVPRTRNGK